MPGASRQVLETWIVHQRLVASSKPPFALPVAAFEAPHCGAVSKIPFHRARLSTRWKLTVCRVSSMVGTGIFSVPSSIIGSTGSVGAALLLWFLGFILAHCGMFVWLEWGCLYPRSGGEKVYLNIAYPRPRLLALTLFTIQAIFLSTPGQPPQIPPNRRKPLTSLQQPDVLSSRKTSPWPLAMMLMT